MDTSLYGYTIKKTTSKIIHVILKFWEAFFGIRPLKMKNYAEFNLKTSLMINLSKYSQDSPLRPTCHLTEF